VKVFTTRPDAFNLIVLFQVGDFNIRVFPSALGEYLDAEVMVFKRFRIVCVGFPVENHGLGTGPDGIDFQRQFVGRDRQPDLCRLSAG